MSPAFKINVWAESVSISYKYPSIFPTAANIANHFILLNYTTMPGKKCCSVEPHYTYKVI